MHPARCNDRALARCKFRSGTLVRCKGEARFAGRLEAVIDGTQAVIRWPNGWKTHIRLELIEAADGTEE